MSEWLPIDTAPKDGTPIWTHTRGDDCARLLHWETAEELADRFCGNPDEYVAGWVLESDPDSEWYPGYWLPNATLPEFPK